MKLTKKKRQELIDRMVEDDINLIRQDLDRNETDFLDAILRGEGWVQYGNLTDKQVLEEYEAREYDDAANK